MQPMRLHPTRLTWFLAGAELIIGRELKNTKHTFLGDDKILVALQEKSKEDDSMKNLSDGEQLVHIGRQPNFFYNEEKLGN